MVFDVVAFPPETRLVRLGAATTAPTGVEVIAVQAAEPFLLYAAITLHG